MKISVLTLFANIFEYISYTYSLWKKARENFLVDFVFTDLRNFSKDKHFKVDDYPYGGGAGMIMKVAPIYEGIKFFKQKHKEFYTIITSPSGNIFDYNKALQLSKKKALLFVCSHYEGYDNRVENFVDEVISIGDYILSGGEFAVLSMIDAIIRLIPGVISKDSLKEESFYFDNLLEYPQYTRPYNFKGLKVPDILLSGDHKKIKNWRKNKAIERTKQNREELYLRYLQKIRGESNEYS